MKVVNVRLRDENVKTAIKQAIESLREQIETAINAKYPITRIDVGLAEDGEVIVYYNDYSEEERRIEELTTRALEIKTQLAEEADDVKKAVLQAELAKINEEYVRLAGVPIYEVI